MKMANI